MRIAFFEIQGWEKEHLKKSLKKHSLTFSFEPLTLENIKEAKDADVISVFTYSHLSKEILHHLPKLKMIATRSTGFDHIDLKECKARNITVCNVPTYGENTVAEHTFALLLSLSRNVHKSYQRTLRGDYSIEGLKGFDLANKTIGIIGLGNIGMHVLRIAKGFEMNVLVSTKHEDKRFAEQMNFKYVSLKDLLKNSDIITIHCPLTLDTQHLINKKSIKDIKRGAVLINTARGRIVDTEALIEALDKGILSGVGLDVLEGEELLKEEHEMLYDRRKTKKLVELARDHILLSKENVIFTPHIGFYSTEALHRILETTEMNIEEFSKGKAINMVNLF